MLVFGQSRTSRGIFMKQTILFSEILENIPPQDQLIDLFPTPGYPGKTCIKPFGLEVLRLRLQGFTLKQIAEQLGVSYHRVSYWSQTVKNCLHNGHISDRVIVDIPAMQSILPVDIFPPPKYTKLSELLQNMPSDEELLQMNQRYEKLCRAGKRQQALTQQDLYILQQRQSGRTYTEIGHELGMSTDVLRRRIRRTRRILQWTLKIELDVPELFPSVKFIKHYP